MTDTRSRAYIFDTNAEGEEERLQGLQQVADPITQQHLLRLGVGRGWRCLEVAAGAGSIARFLADQVGIEGRVVATDLTTKFLEPLAEERPNVEVRLHDIVREPLEDAAYDLIHARFLLEHLPQRDELIPKFARALAPGGWLLIEDADLGQAGIGTSRQAAVVSALLATARTLMTRHGYDPKWGRRIPRRMTEAGLVEVGAEGRSLYVQGGSDFARFLEANTARIRAIIDGTSTDPAASAPLFTFARRHPWLRAALERPLTGAERALRNPDFTYFSPLVIAAWGRRPAG